MAGTNDTEQQAAAAAKGNEEDYEDDQSMADQIADVGYVANDTLEEVKRLRNDVRNLTQGLEHVKIQNDLIASRLAQALTGLEDQRLMITELRKVNAEVRHIGIDQMRKALQLEKLQKATDDGTGAAAQNKGEATGAEAQGYGMATDNFHLNPMAKPMSLPTTNKGAERAAAQTEAPGYGRAEARSEFYGTANGTTTTKMGYNMAAAKVYEENPMSKPLMTPATQGQKAAAFTNIAVTGGAERFSPPFETTSLTTVTGTTATASGGRLTTVWNVFRITDDSVLLRTGRADSVAEAYIIPGRTEVHSELFHGILTVNPAKLSYLFRNGDRLTQVTTTNAHIVASVTPMCEKDTGANNKFSNGRDLAIGRAILAKDAKGNVTVQMGPDTLPFDDIAKDGAYMDSALFSALEAHPQRCPIWLRLLRNNTSGKFKVVAMTIDVVC